MPLPLLNLQNIEIKGDKMKGNMNIVKLHVGLMLSLFLTLKNRFDKNAKVTAKKQNMELYFDFLACYYVD